MLSLHHSREVSSKRRPLGKKSSIYPRLWWRKQIHTTRKAHSLSDRHQRASIKPRTCKHSCSYLKWTTDLDMKWNKEQEKHGLLTKGKKGYFQTWKFIFWFFWLVSQKTLESVLMAVVSCGKSLPCLQNCKLNNRNCINGLTEWYQTIYPFHFFNHLSTERHFDPKQRIKHTTNTLLNLVPFYSTWNVLSL